MQKFSKGEAIRFGWETVKSNFWLFIGVLIVTGLINGVPGAVSDAIDVPLLVVLIALASFVVNMVVSIGLIRFSLRFCDNEKGKFSDLFAHFNLFFKYFFASILYGLIILGGTMLLVIPGIIWAIKFQFYGYLIVEGSGPIEALKKSWAITAGSKWNLFLFGLLLGLVNLLGLICLFIGLLVTIPITMVAIASVYRKLLAGADETQPSAAAKVTPAPSEG